MKVDASNVPYSGARCTNNCIGGALASCLLAQINADFEISIAKLEILKCQG